MFVDPACLIVCWAVRVAGQVGSEGPLIQSVPTQRETLVDKSLSRKFVDSHWRENLLTVIVEKFVAPVIVEESLLTVISEIVC